MKIALQIARLVCARTRSVALRNIHVRFYRRPVHARYWIAEVRLLHTPAGCAGKFRKRQILPDTAESMS
jgi:hypothetical protein